jgi:hypothetical protein
MLERRSVPRFPSEMGKVRVAMNPLRDRSVEEISSSRPLDVPYYLWGIHLTKLEPTLTGLHATRLLLRFIHIDSSPHGSGD